MILYDRLRLRNIFINILYYIKLLFYPQFIKFLVLNKNELFKRNLKSSSSIKKRMRQLKILIRIEENNNFLNIDNFLYGENFNDILMIISK